jgi:hypothetical protein
MSFVISFLLFEILIPENENTEDGELEEGIEKEKIKKYILLLKTKITCKWNPHEQQLWYSKVNHLNRIHNVN